MIELRDCDLVLFAHNGDPFVRFSSEGRNRFLTVNTNGHRGDGWDDHPLNCRAEQLDEEALTALRDWCESHLEAHPQETEALK